MKKQDIVRAWISLGEARPPFDEFERAMTRPVGSSYYGFMGISNIMDAVFREENCWLYFTLRHALCSRRVARLKAAERRPKYYAAENARRRALAAERRKVRARRTTNACPTREALLDAWTHRRDSHEAAIRFGSLLEDLECYLDNSLRRDEWGAIVGRNPGIKGWLHENLPEIFEKYTTAMRYKAAAKKLKQVVGIADPVPAEAVLPREAAGDGWNQKHDNSAGEIVVPDVAIVRARAMWSEVVKGIGANVTALVDRLDALTDPERVEEANMLAGWRERYENEITVRTKSRWWRRLARFGRRERDAAKRDKVKSGGKRRQEMGDLR